MKLGFDDVVDHYWPIGTYGSDAITGAAQAIPELVRYLNHATLEVTTIPNCSDIDSVLLALATATGGLQQLLQQVQAVVRWQIASNPRTVYDDRPNADAVRTGRELVTELADAVRDLVGLHRALQRAAGHSSHLGNRDKS